jgi:hypothetical protein
MVIKFLKNNLALFMINIYWLFLLVLHNTSLSSIRKASLKIQLLFVLMLLFINIGYFCICYVKQTGTLGKISRPFSSKKLEHSITLWLLLISLILILIGIRSGVFSMSYKAYFLRMRGKDAEALTGIGLLDFGIKIFIYPILLAFLFIELYFRNISKKLVFFTLGIIVFYVYLTQTNYALLAAIYVLGVYFISGYGVFSTKQFVKIVIPLCILIMVAATTRFGKFSFGKIFRYYFVDYYTLGFYMFQEKTQGMQAAGLDFSFGRSLLGPIELYINQFFRTIHLGSIFFPVYTENIDYNAIFIPAKMNGAISNAFDTILFTFYRDFSYPGIFAGSFLLGGLLGYTKKKKSIFCKVLYCYIIFVLLKGNSVSPFEQAYIYMTPFIFYIFSRKGEKNVN